MTGLYLYLRLKHLKSLLRAIEVQKLTTAPIAAKKAVVSTSFILTEKHKAKAVPVTISKLQ